MLKKKFIDINIGNKKKRSNTFSINWAINTIDMNIQNIKYLKFWN